MTIFLGTPVLDAGSARVLLPAPVGFASVLAMRVANTTTDVVVLVNAHGTDQSQEYLLPLTQLVYRMSNVTSVPSATGLSLPVASIEAGLLVEFSSDPDTDFPGTYPYPMSVS